MFAHLLAAPFFLSALVVLYLAWEVDGGYAPWMVPFILCGSLIYVFAPQINWWWYSKRPPELSPGMKEGLARFCGFYKRLQPVDQKRFRDRVALFQMGTDWTPQSWPDDELPPDIKLALSAQAVMLTWQKEHFLFDRFEKVIVYPRSFLTPEYPFEHASELFMEDGCLIFSGDHLMKAFIEEGAIFNIGLYEYARAFTLTWPEEPYPLFDEAADWPLLEALSNMSREYIEKVIGIAGIPVLPVAIHHYFIFGEKFRAAMPEKADLLAQIFLRRDALEQGG